MIRDTFNSLPDSHSPEKNMKRKTSLILLSIPYRILTLERVEVDTVEELILSIPYRILTS